LNSRNQAPVDEKEPRPIARAILFFVVMAVVVIVIVGTTGLLIYNSLARPRHEGKAIAPNVTVAPFVSINEDNVFPMGMTALSDGSFALSLYGRGTLVKVDAQGITSPIATNSDILTATGAVAATPDGNLYVIDYNSPRPVQAVGTLKRISPDGKVESTGYGSLPLFAQLAVDSDGNLYVTVPSSASSKSSQVWRCGKVAGNLGSSWCNTQWWTPPAVGQAGALPTGIVYDPAHKAVIVADAGTGSLYRIAIGEDGKAGETLMLNREANLETQAMALDGQGRLLYLVWRNENGQLNRLESDGGITVLADGFRAPTGLVVKDNKIYVVNSDITGLIPPILGIIPSPVQARPPFTVDVVTAN
jgi:sugar lactone lactonase YvrE